MSRPGGQLVSLTDPGKEARLRVSHSVQKGPGPIWYLPEPPLLCCPLSLSRCGLLTHPTLGNSPEIQELPACLQQPPVFIQTPCSLNHQCFLLRVQGVPHPTPRLCLIQNHLSAFRGSSARSFFFSVKSSRILLALKHICSVGSVCC